MRSNEDFVANLIKKNDGASTMYSMYKTSEIGNECFDLDVMSFLITKFRQKNSFKNQL